MCEVCVLVCASVGSLARACMRVRDCLRKQDVCVRACRCRFVCVCACLHDNAEVKSRRHLLEFGSWRMKHLPFGFV